MIFIWTFVKHSSQMKNLLLISFLFLGTICFSQNSPYASNSSDSVRFVQLTGIIITDSMMRVPFAKVVDLSTRRGTIADYYGYFALVVHPGDTIQFSSLGFKKKQYIVPDSTKLAEISLVQLMTEDTIMLPKVTVYPWPSKEEFAKAFVEMELVNTEMALAQQRLSPQEMAFVGALLSGDGSEAYSYYRTVQLQQNYTRGQSPRNNLLNPAAWSEFINGIGTGRYQISQ